MKDQQNVSESVTSAVNQSVQEDKTPTQIPQQYTATVDPVSLAIGEQQKMPLKQDRETTEDIPVSKSLCLPLRKHGPMPDMNLKRHNSDPQR